MYDTRIIISENHTEVRRYKFPIKRGYKNTIKKKSREKTDEVIKENINRTIRRAKESFCKILYANYDINKNNSLLTLTFKEKVQDLNDADKRWKLFREKVERDYGIKLKYCGVREYQDGTKEYEDKYGNKHKGTGRDSIHFHIVLFDVPYLDFNNLIKIWNKYSNGGGLHIKHINDIHIVAKYLCNHIGKYDDKLFKNNKWGRRYISSRNLKKCEDIKYNKDNLNDKIELEKKLSKLEGKNPDFKSINITDINVYDENGIPKSYVIQETSREVYNFSID